MNIDWSVIISNGAGVLVSGALCAWVYKVLKFQNDLLREQIKLNKEEFRAEINELKAKLEISDEKANKWFRRYFLLANIIEKFHCKKQDCTVYKEYTTFNEKHGEIV
jgi:hypothetical protein